MRDLDVRLNRPKIEALVSRYIQARVEILDSKASMGNRLGRSMWGGSSEIPVIQLPARITAKEIEESLLVLAIRGRTTGFRQLGEHADEIDTPEAYLEHLVLHEVAHIANNWGQDKETECDLWVYEQLHPNP